MDDVKKNRLALRRRLEHAQYVIFRRDGWTSGMAHKMAKERTNSICSEIARERSIQKRKESDSRLIEQKGGAN